MSADDGDGSDAVALLIDYLAAQSQALNAGDVSLRQGLDAVHRTRVGTRRLRSTLRVFSALFDEEESQRLDEELRWYAGLLGEVRDRQVQRARFVETVAVLPHELVLGPVTERIDERLAEEQEQHRAELSAALETDRYRELLATVEAWAVRPPVVSDIDVDGVIHPAKKAFKRADKRLAKALAADGDEDAALHRARKAAKRARYAAELVEPVVGKKARKAAKRYTATQDALGEHQDSVVAAALVRELGASVGVTPWQNGFTYGVLYEREQRAGRRSRKAALRIAEKRHGSR